MVRVCVIGAGPSGMSFLREVQRLKDEDPSVCIESVCFEKQSSWGGLWNFNWRIGTDEFGEPVHNTMYKHLWTNVPKEVLEYFDYTYQEHFKKNLPSYLPREAMRDYLEGYWSKHDMSKNDIRFNHAVSQVDHDSEVDKFKVKARDLRTDRIVTEEFDYVINCTGHFSTPRIPLIEGLESFPNTVIHSGLVRTFDIFQNKRILVIGAGYSGDDVAIQSIKFGADSVIVSYKDRPMAAKYPSSITERPQVRRVNGTEVTFKDDSQAEVDIIIIATGYHHHYPYMSEDLRLIGPNKFFPEELHNCTVLRKGGNHKVLYHGAMNQFITFPLFRVQGRWSALYLAGKINLGNDEEMAAIDSDLQQRESSATSLRELVRLQNDWMLKLSQECDYGVDMGTFKAMSEWLKTRVDYGLGHYKNCRFTSKYNNERGAEMYQTFMEIKDDTLNNLLSRY